MKMFVYSAGSLRKEVSAASCGKKSAGQSVVWNDELVHPGEVMSKDAAGMDRESYVISTKSSMIQDVCFVCLMLFYALARVFQLYHGGDMIYEMKRRKPEPTLLPTQGSLTSVSTV